MAEGAQAPPTFKLVLVGDGGTGKASKFAFVEGSVYALRLEMLRGGII